MNEHILQACLLDGKGGSTPLSKEQLADMGQIDGVVFIYFDGSRPETRDSLKTAFPMLDLLVQDALLDVDTRPRMTQMDEGVLLMLRGANLNDGQEPEDMVSVSVWADPNRIICVSYEGVRALGDIYALLQSGKGPKDSGQFLSMLCKRLIQRLEPTLSALDDATDAIEELVLVTPDLSLREQIADVRGQAIAFRRYLAPQRDAIDLLLLADIDWLEERHRRHFQESYNHVTRHVEDLDAIRERCQIVKDEIAHAQADRLNRQMYMLSVITAIFLPLGFMTGLLGINVAGIPGAGDGSAFWIFVGLLAGIVAIQIALFKWLRWF
nr:zinc transporter ZntB [uncultured Cohaesibacter sp.]